MKKKIANIDIETFDKDGYACYVITLEDGTQDVTHAGDGCYELITALFEKIEEMKVYEPTEDEWPG